MAVAQLADAAPSPVVERRLDAALGQRRIAFEDQDLAAVRRESQRGEQPGHAGAEDQQLFGHG